MFVRRVNYLEARLDTLKVRIDGVQALLEQRAAFGDKTLEVAKETLNGMRDMALDQASRLLPRAEYEAKHKELTVQIDRINTDLIEMRGVGKGALGGWQTLISFVAVAVAAASLIYALHK